MCPSKTKRTAQLKRKGILCLDYQLDGDIYMYSAVHLFYVDVYRNDKLDIRPISNVCWTDEASTTDPDLILYRVFALCIKVYSK